jgi:hypothetical protein
MRYIIILLFVLAGCKDDSPPNPSGKCNCGTIANDGISGSCFWLEIRNECSGNKKKFCIDQDVWITAHPGNDFCITNSNGW